jgi:hypothetical protein
MTSEITVVFYYRTLRFDRASASTSRPSGDSVRVADGGILSEGGGKINVASVSSMSGGDDGVHSGKGGSKTLVLSRLSLLRTLDEAERDERDERVEDGGECGGTSCPVSEARDLLCETIRGDGGGSKRGGETGVPRRVAEEGLRERIVDEGVRDRAICRAVDGLELEILRARACCCRFVTDGSETNGLAEFETFDRTRI